MSLEEDPEASNPMIVPTVTRKPRIQGFPPMTRGFNVIRVSCLITLDCRFLKLRCGPKPFSHDACATPSMLPDTPRANKPPKAPLRQFQMARRGADC